MDERRKTGKQGVRLGFFLNLGLAIVFAGAAIYLINVTKTRAREQALLEAESKAQIILDRNLAIHTYFSHALKPAVFELTDPIRPVDYFEPSWMSSTYAVREIDKNFMELNNEKYYYKECAINARSPQNEADEFERAFINELNDNPDLEYRSLVRNLNGNFYYVVLRRGEVMEDACLRCHSTPDQAPENLVARYGSERSFNRSVNETVSAISIRVPLSVAYTEANQFSRQLAKIFIIVLLLLFVVQYLMYRFFILKPITRLKNTTNAVIENDELLGQEIPLPVSYEFRDLTSAFNSMSRKLRYHLDHLEDTVHERTRELEQANDRLQQSLDEIKTLQGIIPICMHCKKIRDDVGLWNQLEDYISDHSDAQFSHGICDNCMEKYYPETKK